MQNAAKYVVFVASLAIAGSTSLFAGQPATDPVATYTNANGTMPGLKQLLPTFDFQGGSVTEFVDALRLAARPRELNIIVLDPMPGTKISPVKLRNISVESALQLLRGPLAGSPIDVTWIVPDNVLDNPVVYIKRPNTVASELAERAAQEQRRKTVVLSSQIGPPRSGEEGKARDMQLALTLDALGEALNLNVQPGKPSPSIKVHNPSGLLFVVGEPSEIAIAREVVDRISQDAREAQKAEASQNEIAQLRRELEVLKVREAAAKADLVKPSTYKLQVALNDRWRVRRAVESVLLQEANKPGRTFDIVQDKDGLVFSGDHDLVQKAEYAARGARFAIRDSATAPTNEEAGPVEKK